MGAHAGLYIVKAIDALVSLEARTILPGIRPTKATVQLRTFIKDWACFKGDLPFVLEDEVVSKQKPDATIAFVGDLAKTGLFYALADYQKKHGAKHADLFFFAMSPMAMFAKKKIPTGGCTFVPVVPLQNIMLTHSSSHGFATDNHVEVDNQRKQLYITRPSMPSVKDASQKSQATNASVHPFFWVEKTSDKKAANIVSAMVEHMGFKLPILVNRREIGIKEKICIYEAAKLKASFVVEPSKKQRIV